MMRVRSGVTTAGSVFFCTALGAQTTAIGTRRIVTPKISAQSIAAQDSINKQAPLTPETLDLLLKRFGSPEAHRAEAAKSLLPLLSSISPSRSTVADVLREVAKIPLDRVEGATDALIRIASGGESRGSTRSFADLFFSELTASATPDRAIVSNSIVEFPSEAFTLRFVTAVAVSNAKDEEQEESGEEFRTATADLLAILQEGGNGVLRLVIPVARERLAPDWRLGFAIDGGVMGDWLSVDTKSRYIAGGVFEVGRVFRSARSDEEPEHATLHTALRTGARFARKGILDGVDRKELPFLQGVLEFRLPNGAVPFGVSINVVPKEFRPYTRSVHLYARAAR